jgi:ring-1,2-phenylacetyl-CoA epoxidase subunit PaaE
LFYGNKTSKSVIFKEQIEALKNTYMNRLEVHHVLSREDQGSDLLKGRIDALKCGDFSQRFFDIKEVSGYFLCGPEAMINGVSAKLQDLGAEKATIHFELFTSPTDALAGKTKVEKKSTGSKVDSKLTVILDGDETHFDLNADGDSVLDAALDAGADVPYACKGAVCCTCRAKVLEGEVEMDMNYALEDEEVADGYVLTCQSHPRSEKVVISFDD